MNRRTSLLAGVAIAALAAIVSVACGGDNDDHGKDDDHAMDGGGHMSGEAPAGSIEVLLVNWAVEPAQESAKAGKVTFWAVHEMGHSHSADEGGNVHDLQVMKKSADGGFELVGQVQGLRMGQAKALTLDLAPGDYELACNVVEEVNGNIIPHYTKGMRTPFKVTA